jgi:hypothetical protein
LLESVRILSLASALAEIVHEQRLAPSVSHHCAAAGKRRTMLRLAALYQSGATVRGQLSTKDLHAHCACQLI